MAVTPDYITGTITLTNGSANFTGTGTGWAAAAFKEGDTIIDLEDATEWMGVIASIAGPGTGTLTQPWAGPTLTDVTYRMRYQPDNSRVTAQARTLIELLGNGNLQAFADLDATADQIPIFTGPGSMTLINKGDLINGVRYDVQVDTLPDRAIYDAQAVPFSVLINDYDGTPLNPRSAVTSKNSNTSGDWSGPAYVTGATGAAPNLDNVNATSVPAGSPASGSFTETSPGVYDLDLEIPAGADGDDGLNGTDPGVLMDWNTGTTDADPGAGNVRANNATWLSATTLYVSKTNRAGNSIAAFLASLDDSTSAIKGKLSLTSAGGTVQGGGDVTGITDATGYVKVAVSSVWGASFAGGTAISLQFVANGDAGTGAVASVNGQSGVVVLAASDVGAQPVDSDLTAIAALSTTSYGRALLELANQAGLMALLLAASTTAAGISEFANAAEYRTGTDTERSLVVSEVWLAAQLAALTDGANIAVDFAAGFNFGGASNAVLALAGNRTLDAPSNLMSGKSGVLWFGAATSTRTLTLNAAWLLLDGIEAGPYSITTAQELGIAYTIRNTRVYVTAIMRRAA